MNIYKVYGRKFTNKKDALKYHHNIHGYGNYSASTVYKYRNGQLIGVADLSRNKLKFTSI